MKGSGERARLGGARVQDAFQLRWVVDQRVVALAHRRDLAVDALEQQLLGVAPGDAVGVGLAQLLRFLRGDAKAW